MKQILKLPMHKLKAIFIAMAFMCLCVSPVHSSSSFVIRFYSESSWSDVNAWVWPSNGSGSNKHFTSIGNNWWQYNETSISGNYYVIFRQSNNWNNDNPRSSGDGAELNGAVHRKCTTGGAHAAVTGTNYFYIKRQKSSNADDWGWVKLTKSGTTWKSGACVFYKNASCNCVNLSYSESEPSSGKGVTSITNYSAIASGSDVIFKVDDNAATVSIEYATAEVKYAVGNVAGGNATVTYVSATGTTTTPSTTTSTTLQSVNAAYSKKVTYTASASQGYEFVGWYSGSTTSTTLLSDESSWETTINSSGKTAYALFAVSCDKPTITTDTEVNSECGGAITLTASASAGDVKWYDALTAGNLLYTGEEYVTSIGDDTNFYVEADDDGCVSDSRTTVSATYIANPTVTIVATGVNPPDNNATYPWEYFTLTVTSPTNLDVTWNNVFSRYGYEPANSVKISSGHHLEYQFKSAITREGADHYTVTATVTDGNGCSGSSVDYDFYINSAPAELCE